MTDRETAMSSPDRLFDLLSNLSSVDALRGRRQVLHLDGTRVLELPVGHFVGPHERCRGLRGRPLRRCYDQRYSAHVYNPAIAEAPPGLCARCRFIVAARVATQHQCDAAGATNLGFSGSAIVVLDEKLELLAWDWWFSKADVQLAPTRPATAHGLRWLPYVHDASLHHADAATGAFAVPYPWSHHDTRLLTVPLATAPLTGGLAMNATTSSALLLATVQCRQCKSFNVMTVHLRATPTSDGGLREIRAWSTPRGSVAWPLPGLLPRVHPRWGSLAGSNRACDRVQPTQPP